MLRVRTPGRVAAAMGATVLMIAATGCAGRVKQETLDDEMAKLRSEMSSQMQGLTRRVDSLDQRTAGLQSALTELRQEFDTRIAETEGMMSFNVPVHFEFDDATLREQDQPVLNRFTQVVNRYYTDALITVEGFTDPAGDRQYNLWLGEQRAQAVREYLAQTGMDGARIKVVSYGESGDRLVTPGAMGPGPEGMENRRVALVIDYRGDATAPMARGSDDTHPAEAKGP